MWRSLPTSRYRHTWTFEIISYGVSIFCLCQSPDFKRSGKMNFKMAFSSFKGLCCFNEAMCYFSTYQTYAHQDKLHKYWLLTKPIWTQNAATQVMWNPCRHPLTRWLNHSWNSFSGPPVYGKNKTLRSSDSQHAQYIITSVCNT